MDNQRILRLLRLILGGITFIYLCISLLDQIGDPDFFWHLATGRWIVEHLSFPAHDPFNYTTPVLLSSREHFILTSYWLTQVLYYGIYYVFGWNGFVFLRFIILGVIIYFTYKRAKDSDRTVLFSIIAIASVVFVQICPLERPHIFSFLFFAVLLYLLENLKNRVNSFNSFNSTFNLFNLLKLFKLPLLMLLWANMHGGYIVGQGVILVYLISEGLRFLHPALNPMDRLSYKKFLITGVVGILSALINPNTYKAITEMWNLSKYSSMMFIIEHQSTITLFKDFYTYSIPAYWLLLFIASVSLLYRIIKKRFDLQDIVLLACLGYFSFTQVRYIVFFLIWAVPFIAISLTTPAKGEGIGKVTPLHPPLDKGGKEGDYLKYICIILSIFIIAVLITREKKFDNIKNITSFKTGQWVNDNYPEDAVHFIMDNDIKGNMYNFYGWGGYLIWRFYPEKKIFMDGRNLYEPQFFQYMHIFNAISKPEIMGTPYYKAILESYRVRYMVIPIFASKGTMPRVLGEIVKDKEWIPVFLKDNSMILVKDTSENYDVIHRYAIPKDKFVSDLFKMLDDGIKESPRDFRLYLARGDLYLSQNRFKEARREYKKVLEINPLNHTAQKKLESINMNYQK